MVRAVWNGRALLLLLALCFGLVAWAETTPTALSRRANGASDVITWDNYTLILHDQRLFLQYVPSRLKPLYALTRIAVQESSTPSAP